MTQQLELGLDTFGDVTVDAEGNRLPYAQVIRNVVEQGVLADSLGVPIGTVRSRSHRGRSMLKEKLR